MAELLAPNVKPSNLTPEQYLLVRTSEFKKWFGDWEKLALTKLYDSGIDEISFKRLEDGVSKVVDSNGEPLPVYHGTNAEPFVVFDGGSFFTDDYMNADGYASGEMVYEVFLNIKKPLIINARERKWDNLKNKYGNSTRNIIGQLDMDKYDGVIFNNINDNWFDDEMGDTQNVYFSINPEQIKLADGTNTTFDGNNPDIRFDEGGDVIINPTEIDCHNCHWEWKVKDGGDDLFICHKCNYDNSKFYKFEGLEGEKILDTISYKKGGQLLNLNKIGKGHYEAKSYEIDISLSNPKIANGFGTNKWQLVILYGNDSVINEWFDTKNEALKTGAILLNDFLNSNFKKGGRTIAQTPAPKKDQIKGSDKNKEGSSKDLKSAKKIELSDSTNEAIKNKVDKHNEKHPKKKITIDSAKAVVRRGMGAYSSSYRPTISGGKPNSRVAWGLARLNAFLYKIVNGKSKSGKYSQDNDLIEELGYKVDKFEIGGDIQAYEEAMGVSEFDEGGEAKPKKVYVSIRLPSNAERMWKKGDSLDNFNKYFFTFDERPFQELQNGKLLGLVGVSTSPNNIAEWFILRDCLIVMDYDEFMAINETEIINYYDPYQLMKNDLYLFRRLYANVTRYGEQNDSVNQTIKKICEKILPEINLEMNLSSGQKYSELYRISRFLDPYQTSAFTRWIENNKMKIESPIDLTNAILDFNKLYDDYLGSGYENPVLTFDELLPIVEKGITNASKIYESEHEIVLINRELNIPKKSQLFFIAKDEVGQNRDSNRDELIEKYNLKELYKVYFVDKQEIQKYRDFWVKKEEQKFKNEIEKGREDLELKKEQVLDELLNYFLDKSISYIKNELEKEIIEYNESLDFYDETDDNSVEQNLFSIPLVVSLMNTYELIIKNFWKSFIQKKQVRNLDLYAFDMFYFNVESELKKYFENNKNELEKLNNYRNVRGRGSLDPYRFERLLLKTINDYEKLPELIDFKELAKMYLDKMGREIYRYYHKKDLPLISQYKEGGESGGDVNYKNQPRDLSQIENYENIYKGAEFCSFSDSSEKQEKSDRWFELFRINQKERQLTTSEFIEFMKLSNELNWEEFADGGKTDEPTHFWGDEAGGVFIYCSKTDRYLILLRSGWVKEPNTWGIISGKLDDDETNIEDAVLREAEEEIGYKLRNLIPTYIFQKQNFKFHNFVSIVNEEFIPELNSENTDYKWVKLNEMPDNLHFGLKLLIEKEDLPKLIEKNKNNAMNKSQNPKDTITMDIPLLIRFAELMRKEIKTDVALHEIVKNLLEIKDKGTLTLRDYDSIVGNVTGTEKNGFISEQQIEAHKKMSEKEFEEGGKVNSIKSKKGDIKISLDENWYSDDTDVELVPVSELMKFREFDRKVKPKYNKENSIDNINHLKFMFQKEGVKSPLIIEYSPQDNSVLIIEGNHRLNSAIDLGMEYLPARVVLKKHGTFTPNQLKNTMQVSGVKADESGYIKSSLKPSEIGIEGVMPIIYREGGIIKGRLHSECGDDGCGRKFQVGEGGHTIEAERDEAVIVPETFNDNQIYTIEGTPSEIASALNVMGGGKKFNNCAEIINDKKTNELLKSKKQAKDTDVDDVIGIGAIIINRRSMADKKKYKVTGTPKQIASSINSIDGNGVVIEEGATIKKIN